MKHLTPEQIVLHCYGDALEGREIENHLQSCTQCRAEFAEMRAFLAEIPATPVPEPPVYLEEKLWLNLRDRLSEEKQLVWRGFFAPRRWTAIGAVAVLVIAAFFAGRFWPHSIAAQNLPESVQVNPERVVLVAVGDHLERSQILLVEIMNANPKDVADFSEERQQARNLLDDNRLYRVSAQQDGKPAVANLLDELERVLTEVANSPEQMTPGDVKEIRRRIQSEDLLFKIHVVGSTVLQPGNQASTSPATQRL
ncbi:MAG TPA: hypothetical protein VI636_00385 [Candidatus Angelobacter sp.]